MAKAQDETVSQDQTEQDEATASTDESTQDETQSTGPGRKPTKPVQQRAMEQYVRTANTKRSYETNQAKLDRITASMTDAEFETFKTAVDALKETPATSRLVV